jgi:hypothetical protein
VAFSGPLGVLELLLCCECGVAAEFAVFVQLRAYLDLSGLKEAARCSKSSLCDLCACACAYVYAYVCVVICTLNSGMRNARYCLVDARKLSPLCEPPWP